MTGRVGQDAGAPAKSDQAFRTISEVAAELDVKQHVLRFWEGKFPQVKPIKRAGGRRYYRPEDIELLRAIRDLLKKDGLTIKGVQKLLREVGPKAIAAGAEVSPADHLRTGSQTSTVGSYAESITEEDEANSPAAVASPEAELTTLLGELRLMKSLLEEVSG